jgi:hypothetical protein
VHGRVHGSIFHPSISTHVRTRTSSDTTWAGTHPLRARTIPPWMHVYMLVHVQRGSSTRPRGRAGSRPTCRTPKSGSQRALHARPEAAAHGRRLSPDALQGPAPGQPINCGVMAGFGVCCCAPYVPCPCMMYVRACAGHTRLRTELASN